MSCVLRETAVDELPALSALCVRSKAVWGYDSRFMEACRQELMFEPGDLQSTFIKVAEKDGKIAGVAQIRVVSTQADLLKLFVEPTLLRVGVGVQLFLWAADQAKSKGATSL